MHCQREHRLVPVLFVGQGDPALAERLWEHGIGVIRTNNVGRALYLLTNFTVAAVIYEGPAVDQIPDFAAGTRVIALVDEQTEWTCPGVTVLPRTALVEAIAAAVQECAAAVGRLTLDDGPDPHGHIA